jgi:hypothetical protein
MVGNYLAPTGRLIVAQGSALGYVQAMQALKGRSTEFSSCRLDRPFRAQSLTKRDPVRRPGLC